MYTCEICAVNPPKGDRFAMLGEGTPTKLGSVFHATLCPRHINLATDHLIESQVWKDFLAMQVQCASKVRNSDTGELTERQADEIANDLTRGEVAVKEWVGAWFQDMIEEQRHLAAQARIERDKGKANEGDTQTPTS